jgi:hypothetical protein
MQGPWIIVAVGNQCGAVFGAAAAALGTVDYGAREAAKVPIRIRSSRYEIAGYQTGHWAGE